MNLKQTLNKPLYLFNPEHDLALASGETNYMAPLTARQMAEELALLPIWYAEPESYVLASSSYNLDFLRRMKKMLSMQIDLMTEIEVSEYLIENIRPWGWNQALCRKLQNLKVSDKQLPTLEEIIQLRESSHRLRAVELLSRLKFDKYFCGESIYLSEPEAWKEYVESHACCLLKAPLSGSGKGLNWCKGVFTSSISGWCTRIGALQGGVVGEPIYDKESDFAMEFYSDGKGQVTFVGYSMFYTSKSGAYEGNYLASNEEIVQKIRTYIPVECISMLRLHLVEELSQMFGGVYTGYLGVDMMICRFKEAPELRIHPCVEINLRMNMGVVARLLYDRYIYPTSMGEFRVSYHSSPGDALQTHVEMERKYLLQIERDKIRSGYLSLIPVHAKSNYRAWILVS